MDNDADLQYIIISAQTKTVFRQSLRLPVRYAQTGQIKILILKTAIYFCG